MEIYALKSYFFNVGPLSSNLFYVFLTSIDLQILIIDYYVEYIVALECPLYSVLLLAKTVMPMSVRSHRECELITII